MSNASKNKKFELTIAQKVALFVFIMISVFALITTAAGYLYFSSSLRGSAGEDYSKMANLMADSVARVVNWNLEYIRAKSGLEAVISAVEKSNLKYNKDEESNHRYLMDMDKKWTELPNDHPLIKEYLDSDISNRLKVIMSETDKSVEIILTDRHGGLVGATRRSRDFYYADKDWWKETFDGGKGKVFAGDVVFDELLGVWTIPFAIPVKNEVGEVIGIWRSSIDIRLFFAPLEGFKIGKLGEAVLIDDKSYLLYKKGVKPFANKFCEYKYLQNVLQGKSKWLVIDGVYGYPGKVFAVFAEVDCPVFLNKGINWLVVITRDAKDASVPSNTFLLRLILTMIVIIVLTPLIARAIFYGIFERSIKKISDGMNKLAGGDMTYTVEPGSSDELGRLADSFNTMIESLKKIVVPVTDFNKEAARRKKAEAQLSKTTEEMQRVFNVFTDIIFSIDTNFNITDANTAFFKAIGLVRAEDVIGKKCFDLLGVLDKAIAKHLIDRQVLNIKGPHTEEVYNINTGKTFMITEAPIFNEYGELVSIIHVIRDVTDLRTVKNELENKEEELKRIGRIKSDLVSIISRLHLSASAAKSGLDTVFTEVSGSMSEKQKRTIAEAKNNVSNIAKFMDDVNDAFTVKDDKTHFKAEEVDIRSVIRKVVFAAEPRIRDNGLDLKLDVPKNPVIANIDVNRIANVFAQLIDNAIRFTEKGHIVVAVRELKNDIECSVADTGVGIPKEDVPRIFEPFQHYEGGRRSSDIGFGLSLSIVKSIVEKHAGKIWVESEVGQGTTFTFTLPKVSK